MRQWPVYQQSWFFRVCLPARFRYLTRWYHVHRQRRMLADRNVHERRLHQHGRQLQMSLQHRL